MPMIPWRESTRERASRYKNPYEGFTRDDYSIDFEKIPTASIVEMVTRSLAHMYNNETVSKVKSAMLKAEKDGTVIDEFKFVHDRRMHHRDAVLNGKLGVRIASASADIDPVIREMQYLAHARLVAAATNAGRTDFPAEYTVSSSKIVITGKKTLAEMVAQLIAVDDGTMRAKAQAKVEADRAARVATADDAATALFEEEDEEEEEDEAAE